MQGSLGFPHQPWLLPCTPQALPQPGALENGSLNSWLGRESGPLQAPLSSSPGTKAPGDSCSVAFWSQGRWQGLNPQPGQAPQDYREAPSGPL